MIVQVFLLVAGFVLLIKGADWLVAGASNLARTLNISDMVIGLTIVAFGTSMPEFVVGIMAAVRGNPDICIGNVPGSNICNILLILGISAIIRPIGVTLGTVWKEIPFMLMASMVLGIQVNDGLINNMQSSALNRSDGLILLVFLCLFMYYIISVLKATPRPELEYRSMSRSWRLSTFWTIVGTIALIIGGRWVVTSATQIAQSLGASEMLIGLTIIAIGSSLPELATSTVAAFRNNADIAVGNVVGSSIFNILLVLGASSVIAPLPFDPAANVDALVMIAATVLLFIAMFCGRPHHEVQRYEGIGFVILYFIYIGWVLIRG